MNSGKFRSLCLAALSLLPALSAGAATSVTRHGITWNFAKDHSAGQFANGDPWVAGPVTITSITPGSAPVNGVTMHGSMLNHPGAQYSSKGGAQGFDSRIRDHTYSADLNAALRLPLSVPAGSSLMSSVSMAADTSTTHDCQMQTIAILTVLDRPAPAGSFRPPYTGSDRTLRWNAADLDFSKLGKLPVGPNAPSLASMEAHFERPWIEVDPQYTGRYMHPQLNQPGYGRDMVNRLSPALLSLQLNYTNEQKRTLAIRLVQYGIDIYGAALSGAVWSPNGGHSAGRKMPLLLAGMMLNDTGMLHYADATQKFIFQEDCQTFFVSQADVDRARYTGDGRRRDPYTAAMIGMPEWGEKHSEQASRDGSNWDVNYRHIVGSSAIGTILCAKIMKAENLWNHPAAFAYFERYFAMEGAKAAAKTDVIRPFVAEVWKANEALQSLPLKEAPPAQPNALRIKVN